MLQLDALISTEQCHARGARLARLLKWKVVSPCPVMATVELDRGRFHVVRSGCSPCSLPRLSAVQRA